VGGESAPSFSRAYALTAGMVVNCSGVEQPLCARELASEHLLQEVGEAGFVTPGILRKRRHSARSRANFSCLQSSAARPLMLHTHCATSISSSYIPPQRVLRALHTQRGAPRRCWQCLECWRGQHHRSLIG
jgi:hypothetical protein